MGGHLAVNIFIFLLFGSSVWSFSALPTGMAPREPAGCESISAGVGPARARSRNASDFLFPLTSPRPGGKPRPWASRSCCALWSCGRGGAIESDLAREGVASVKLFTELVGDVRADPGVHLMARGDGSEDFARKYGF